MDMNPRSWWTVGQKLNRRDRITRTYGPLCVQTLMPGKNGEYRGLGDRLCVMGKPTHTFLPEFISPEDTVHLLEMALKRTMWLYHNPNGDVGVWFPEKSGEIDLVLEHAIIHSRLAMEEPLVADGDVVFLKYPEGKGMRLHTDERSQGRHMRCGILLQAPEAGGELYMEEEKVPMLPGDAVIYRADAIDHWVTPILDGERYMLTVGTIY